MDEKLQTYLNSQDLLPHQENFVTRFLTDQARYWELVSPVGSGKTRIGTNLAAYTLHTKPNARVLILAPRPLLDQWMRRLAEDCEEPSILADRGTILEYQEANPAGNVWPNGAVVVVSIDTAKLDTVAQSFIDGYWDLVVVDESHRLSGKSRDLLTKLLGSDQVERALFLTATPQSPKPFESLEREIITIDQILNEDRTKSIDLGETDFFEFWRSDQERKFLRQLLDLADTVADAIPGSGPFVRQSLIRSASSSLLVVENTLRRLQENWSSSRNELAHSVNTFEEILLPQRLLSFDVDTNRIDGASEHTIIHSKMLDFSKQVSSLIDSVSTLDIDTKMLALLDYLSEDRRRNVCVWCSYSETAMYVAAACEDANMVSHCLTGSVSPVERDGILRDYTEKGGVLVVTDVVAEKRSVLHSEEAIHYDVPSSIARFLRRKVTAVGLNLFMKDANESLEWETERLREYLADE